MPQLEQGHGGPQSCIPRAKSHLPVEFALQRWESPDNATSHSSQTAKGASGRAPERDTHLGSLQVKNPLPLLTLLMTLQPLWSSFPKQLAALQTWDLLCTLILEAEASFPAQAGTQPQDVPGFCCTYLASQGLCPGSCQVQGSVV